jgi:hypothetical protein
MTLNPIAPNHTELTINDGTCILFSYKTPVAACLAEGGFIRTAKKWSPTTSRHINKWLDGANAKEVEQAVLDALA